MRLPIILKHLIQTNIMPCLVKEDKYFECILDDPYNPNGYQHTENVDTKYIKKSNRNE